MQFTRTKYFYLFILICFSLTILLPAIAFAQTLPPKGTGGVGINPADPVPVPRGPFDLRGPAGQITATSLIIAIIEIALAIVGFLAVLFLIVGGFRYVTAAGNEDQVEGAKNTIIHAIIGIVIVILSFVIVRVITNALIAGPALT